MPFAVVTANQQQSWRLSRQEFGSMAARWKQHEFVPAHAEPSYRNSDGRSHTSTYTDDNNVTHTDHHITVDWTWTDAQKVARIRTVHVPVNQATGVLGDSLWFKMRTRT